MTRNNVISQFFCMLFLVFLGCGFSHAASYAVEDVSVDVTADTSVDAREKALEEAQELALEKLLQTILLKEDQEKIPAIEPADIPNFIDTYSVQDEKLTGTRYLATYQIRFHPAAINNYLNTYGVKPVSYKPKKTLVIPLLVQKGETSYQDNFWEENWKGIISSRQGDLFLPLLDIEDRFSLKQYETTKDPQVLKNLNIKYGTDVIAIVNFKDENSQDNSPDLPGDDSIGNKEKANQAKETTPYKTEVFVIKDADKAPIQMPGPTLFQKQDKDIHHCIITLIEDIQEQGKAFCQGGPAIERQIILKAYCDTLKCLQSLEKKLESIDLVENVTITKVNNEKASFNVRYQGKFKDLQKALQRLGYKASIKKTGVLIEKMKR